MSKSLRLANPESPEQESGFSLPLVLIAALIVLLGGLMLVDRSSDGVISAAFQRESSDARDAAETGMTRIIGELNRPRNRGLLVKDEASVDEPGTLWGKDAVNKARNYCSNANGDMPDLAILNEDGQVTASNPNIGFQEGDSYRTIYLDSAGNRTGSEATATKAYRLLWVKRQPLVDAKGNPILKVFRSTGHGTVTLAVEGYALRNQQVVSSVRLEKEFQLAPKCCGVPFGGAHGNVNYGYNDEGKSVCIDAAWGFLGGAAQNNSGSITINGVTTIVSDDANATPVNPLYCIADTEADCDFKPTSTPFTFEPAPPILPPIPALGGIASGTITRNTALPTNAGPSTFLRCTAPAGGETTLKDCPGGAVTINASVDENNLPRIDPTVASSTYCKLTDEEPPADSETPAGDDKEELRCNLALLDYSGLTITFENTTSQPLRLYFPVDGDVVRATGSASLIHPVLPGEDQKVTDLTLYGCQTCGDQTIKLAGSTSTGSDSLGLFAWFPKGNITIGGNSSYTGVIWANEITSNGGVNWVVPGSGVGSALGMAGYGIPANGVGPSDLNPPIFDWVARATRGFRWFGQ